ncbi:HEAT repeat domain-containing protein [Parasphingorhabdus sp.]|uniref:HEAT repeat domain-containing protein n=1 Tax=Parasphingorhabdus sp. TaxID=2709688 RepID=UPI003A8F1CE6
MNIYESLIRFCLWTTVFLTVGFVLLVLRRWYTELRAPVYLARQKAITHSYIQRVGGFDVEHSDAKWTVKERLQALSHLLMLLRGEERRKLIQLAEIDGLLQTPLRKCTAWRAARRIDAVRTLQRYGGEAVIAKLHEMLRYDRHRIVRLNAAFALASFQRLPPPRETIALIGVPDRAPNRLDVAMLRALAPAYPAELVHILSDVMSHVRRAAIIDALGWSNDPAVLPTLERAASFDNVEIRCAALRSAGKLGHPSVAKWVVRALEDESPVVRIQAVNSSAALRLTQALPLLHVLANDAELWVRLRAEEAIPKLEALVSERRPKSANGAVA